MEISTLLRVLGTLALAAVTALYFDIATERRSLMPPGFRQAWRRGTAATILATLFWLGVYSPLLSLGAAEAIDVSQLDASALFVMHLLMALVLAAWFALGWAHRLDGVTLAAQLGLRTHRAAQDAAIGVAGGVVGWAGALAVMAIVVSAYSSIAGPDAMPQQQPEMIRWLVGLPVLVRLLVSLSAGVVEEVFFRGFLQPRAGIAFSSFLFVIAHAGYDQPFMLVGLTVLSLFLAFLVRWRQTVWPAIIAHFLFDAVQLLIVIPLATSVSPV
jgi:membrane protease YdiL (CAAX protease family)